MKNIGAILQGVLLGVLLFFACYRIVLLQNPQSTKTASEQSRIFTYQFY